jgi:polyhydroxyalkanoate synthesis regulator phasin
MIAQGSALEAVAELSHKRFLANERDLRDVSGAVQNVQTTIGQPIELDTSFDAPTLWSATSFVADEVVRVAEGLRLVEEMISPMRDAALKVETEVGKLAKASNPTKMMSFFKVVSSKMKEASKEIVALKERVNSIETELKEKVTRPEGKQAGKGPRSPTNQTDMDELMDMFGTNRMEVFGNSPEPTNEIRGDDFRELESQIGSMTNQMNQLISEVTILKGASEDKSVKFAGLGWRTLSDCQDWIQVNFASHRYGLIMDPLLMLDRVFGSDDAEGDSQFKVLESRVKLKIATGAEAAVIKSLHFQRPRIFHTGQESMATDQLKSKLNKMKTQKVWKSGGEGVQAHIIKRMNLLLTTISHDINHVLGREPKAQIVATMCLNATVTFLTQLFTYIDSLYENLVLCSTFTPEQGWSLTMKILDRICEDLFAPKEGVVSAMDVAEPASICAHVMW